MKDSEQNRHLQDPENAEQQHSLVCNDELFNKDLRAIVDDTMQNEG
ncbi:hypothetical protein ACQKL0_13060 [Peribacillus sp. NPDC097264]